MSVGQYLAKKMNEGTVHITLIDPSKQSPESAVRMALTAQELGSDLILVMGNIGLTQRCLVETSRAIQEKISIPTVYFPAGSETLAFDFDALFFASLMNSRSVKFITGGLASAALVLKRLNVETLSVGYIVIEPGMKIGEVAEVEIISRENYWLAAGYATAAELLGMQYVFLEAGVGATQPIPAGMIRTVKKEISIPLIVGGGIRTAIDARRVRQAGADMVVTGTVIQSAGYKERLRSILSALKD